MIIGIILAAGRGSRLKAEKKSQPKCFTKINNKPLIDHQIDALSKIGVDEIYIITGFKKFFFKKIKKKTIHNKNWNKTNMVQSLLCADRILKKNECIVSYSDIIYDSRGLLDLKKSKSPISILFDDKWKNLWKKRFTHPLTDAETFKIDKNKNIIEIGKKTKSYKDIEGQYMGLIKFNPLGWEKFKIALKDHFKKGFNKNYLTDIFQKIIEKDISKIKAVKFSGRWCEIDFPKDIKVARKIFRKNGT
jgi:choline kinase